MPITVPTKTTTPQPTFGSNFSSGALDKTKWIASSYTQANYGGAGNTVQFNPANMSFNEGMLCIRLDQPDSGHSVGAEIQSVEKHFFGQYIFVMRMSSTSPTATGEGTVVSGSDSGAFLFYENSETEIDIEYCGGQPNTIFLTNWLNPTPTVPPTAADKQATWPVVGQLAELASGFHTYILDWSPTQVRWLIDGVPVATHTEHVPQVPAYIMINFWGTNDKNWGGLATPGVSRYLYVKSVSFTPAP